MTHARTLAESSGDLHAAQLAGMQPLDNLRRIKRNDLRLLLREQSTFDRRVADIDHGDVLVWGEWGQGPERLRRR